MSEDIGKINKYSRNNQIEMISWKEVFSIDSCKNKQDLKSNKNKINPLENTIKNPGSNLTKHSSMDKHFVSTIEESTKPSTNHRTLSCKFADYDKLTSIDNSSYAAPNKIYSKRYYNQTMSSTMVNKQSNNIYKTARCDLCGLVMFSSNAIKHMWYHHPNELITILNKTKEKNGLTPCLEKFLEHCHTQKDEFSTLLNKTPEEKPLPGSKVKVKRHMTNFYQLAETYMIPQKSVHIYRHKHKLVGLRAHKTRSVCNQNKSNDKKPTNANPTTNISRSQEIYSGGGETTPTKSKSIKTKVSNKPSKFRAHSKEFKKEWDVDKTEPIPNQPESYTVEDNDDALSLGYVSDESSTLSYDDENDTDYAEPVPRNFNTNLITTNTKLKNVSKAKFDPKNKNLKRTTGVGTPPLNKLDNGSTPPKKLIKYDDSPPITGVDSLHNMMSSQLKNGTIDSPPLSLSKAHSNSTHCAASAQEMTVYDRSEILSLNKCMKIPLVRKLLNNSQKCKSRVCKASRRRYHYLKSLPHGQTCVFTPQQSKFSNDTLFAVMTANNYSRRKQVLSMSYFKICTANIDEMKVRSGDLGNGYIYETELLLKNACRQKLKSCRRKASKVVKNKRVVRSSYCAGFLSLFQSLRSKKNNTINNDNIINNNLSNINNNNLNNNINNNDKEEVEEQILDVFLDINSLLAPCKMNYSISTQFNVRMLLNQGFNMGIKMCIYARVIKLEQEKENSRVANDNVENNEATNNNEAIVYKTDGVRLVEKSPSALSVPHNTSDQNLNQYINENANQNISQYINENTNRNINYNSNENANRNIITNNITVSDLFGETSSFSLNNSNTHSTSHLNTHTHTFVNTPPTNSNNKSFDYQNGFHTDNNSPLANKRIPATPNNNNNLTVNKPLNSSSFGDSLFNEAFNSDVGPPQNLNQNQNSIMNSNINPINNLSKQNPNQTSNLNPNQNFFDQNFNLNSNTQNFINQNAVNQNAVNQNSMNQHSMNQHSVNQNAVNQNFINQNVVNQNAVNQNFINQHSVNQNSNANSFITQNFVQNLINQNANLNQNPTSQPNQQIVGKIEQLNTNKGIPLHANSNNDNIGTALVLRQIINRQLHSGGQLGTQQRGQINQQNVQTNHLGNQQRGQINQQNVQTNHLGNQQGGQFNIQRGQINQQGGLINQQNVQINQQGGQFNQQNRQINQQLGQFNHLGNQQRGQLGQPSNQLNITNSQLNILNTQQRGQINQQVGQINQQVGLNTPFHSNIINTKQNLSTIDLVKSHQLARFVQANLNNVQNSNNLVNPNNQNINLNNRNINMINQNNQNINPNNRNINIINSNNQNINFNNSLINPNMNITMINKQPNNQPLNISLVNKPHPQNANYLQKAIVENNIQHLTNIHNSNNLPSSNNLTNSNNLNNFFIVRNGQIQNSGPKTFQKLDNDELAALNNYLKDNVSSSNNFFNSRNQGNLNTKNPVDRNIRPPFTINQNTMHQNTINPNNINPNTINQNNINQNNINQNTINQHTINQNTINQNSINQNNINQNMNRTQQLNQNIMNQNSINQNNINQNMNRTQQLNLHNNVYTRMSLDTGGGNNNTQIMFNRANDFMNNKSNYANNSLNANNMNDRTSFAQQHINDTNIQNIANRNIMNQDQFIGNFSDNPSEKFLNSILQQTVMNKPNVYNNNNHQSKSVVSAKEAMVIAECLNNNNQILNPRANNNFANKGSNMNAGNSGDPRYNMTNNYISSSDIIFQQERCERIRRNMQEGNNTIDKKNIPNNNNQQLSNFPGNKGNTFNVNGERFH